MRPPRATRRDAFGGEGRGLVVHRRRHRPNRCSWCGAPDAAGTGDRVPPPACGRPQGSGQYGGRGDSCQRANRETDGARPLLTTRATSRGRHPGFDRGTPTPPERPLWTWQGSTRPPPRPRTQEFWEGIGCAQPMPGSRRMHAPKRTTALRARRRDNIQSWVKSLHCGRGETPISRGRFDFSGVVPSARYAARAARCLRSCPT